MTTDGQTAKTKVVNLKKLCNFVVDKFLIWNHLVKENYVWISQFWNLNFVNNLGLTNNKNKSVDLEKLYNFVVDNFLIQIHLGSQTLNLISAEDNMRRNKIHYGHKWVWVAVVRGGNVQREGCGFNSRWPWLHKAHGWLVGASPD